jgi:hypothetical protein
MIVYVITTGSLSGEDYMLRGVRLNELEAKELADCWSDGQYEACDTLDAPPLPPGVYAWYVTHLDDEDPFAQKSDPDNLKDGMKHIDIDSACTVKAKSKEDAIKKAQRAYKRAAKALAA